MALIEFKDYPNTDTPINSSNLNYNFQQINYNLEQQMINVNDKIGNLDELNTEDKENILSAINSIIESGSNANGSYLKFSDGTLMCWGKVTFGSITGQMAKNVSVSLPQSYKDTIYNVQLTKVGGGGYTYIVETVMNQTVNGFSIQGWNTTTDTSTLAGYMWSTIGKWK